MINKRRAWSFGSRQASQNHARYFAFQSAAQSAPPLGKCENNISFFLGTARLIPFFPPPLPARRHHRPGGGACAPASRRPAQERGGPARSGSWFRISRSPGHRILPLRLPWGEADGSMPRLTCRRGGRRSLNKVATRSFQMRATWGGSSLEGGSIAEFKHIQ